MLSTSREHDDVIKWRHFLRYWPFVRGIHRSLVNSPHKGQWRGTLMFSLICAWINRWVNNREAGDFRRYRAHYHVICVCVAVWLALLGHNQHIYQPLLAKIIMPRYTLFWGDNYVLSCITALYWILQFIVSTVDVMAWRGSATISCQCWLIGNWTKRGNINGIFALKQCISVWRHLQYGSHLSRSILCCSDVITASRHLFQFYNYFIMRSMRYVFHEYTQKHDPTTCLIVRFCKISNPRDWLAQPCGFQTME